MLGRRLVQAKPMRSGVTRSHATKSDPAAKKTEKKGYEAFGSFHSPSTASLFAQPAASEAEEQHLPTLPTSRLALELPDQAASNADQFSLALQSWTYLNHGAFGGVTRFAAQTAAAWRDQAEQQPLLFNDRALFGHIVRSIKSLSAFAGVENAQELVLLSNATAGLHAVLASVVDHEAAQCAKPPVVVCFSTRYGAVRKMLQSMGDKVRVHEEPLSLAESLDDAALLSKLEQALDVLKSQRCSLVVVDHITSNTGVVLPVEQIVRLCHARQLPVLVDGAHALLNLPLQIDAIGADYYVGNCHKWFCSPKGAAFLHVNSQRSPIERTRTLEIHPRVVSHGFFDGFQSAFMWTGLQDYSPWLALPKCIEYWQFQGVDDCRGYMHTLVQQATELLYAEWGMTQDLALAREFPEHKRHAMRLVKLPPDGVFGIDTAESVSNDSADAKFIQDRLHEDFRIEVPIKCVDGQLYVRLSAHVYNTLSDYQTLARAIRSA